MNVLFIVSLLGLLKTQLLAKIEGNEKEVSESITVLRSEILQFCKENRDSIPIRYNKTRINDKLDSIVEWIGIHDLEINVELSSFELGCLKTKSGDLIKLICDCINAVFSRRSNSKQSESDGESFITQYVKEFPKDIGRIFFSDDSSSFFDNGFLRFLQYCINEGIRSVKVFSYSRSPLETMTRSVERMREINQFISQNIQYFDSIKIDGFDLTQTINQPILELLSIQNEKVWLSEANPRFSKKHIAYFSIAKNEKDLEELEELPTKTGEPSKMEYRALLRAYANKSGVMGKIKFLYANKLKEVDKKTNQLRIQPEWVTSFNPE